MSNITLVRCPWVKLKNPTYVKYHDEEWGVPLRSENEKAIYELFILETFQAGLSWETILMKRDSFRRAYEGFELKRVASFNEEKIASLIADTSIIRNRLKIIASITNSRIILKIIEEFGSFASYIWHFTQGEIINESCILRTSSPLSDTISKDLQRRGMKFVGSTTIYSLLQAMGVINAHTEDCFRR